MPENCKLCTDTACCNRCFGGLSIGQIILLFWPVTETPEGRFLGQSAVLIMTEKGTPCLAAAVAEAPLVEWAENTAVSMPASF